MADLANVFVDIRGRWDRFEREAATQLSGIGGRLGRGIGTAIVGGAGLALAGGAALERIGSSFDAMGDTIRVGTGATGDALRDLEQTAIGIATTIPTSFADAGTAVADLNTRLGLTGEPLDDVASRMLELSRITGTDLSTNIASATRTLGDWGVSVDDMPGTLDALFRASQSTGIGFDTLSQQLVTYGAPLRQLGFGFETSAALLGKFEREGVNAELVMGSLRIALGKMARDGEPAEETLGRVVDQIANAGSTSEANALALELFGARAGPDMAAAIREGRFEVGDLVDTIANGGETILDAAADTNSWRQSLQVLANRGMAKLAPIATRVFDGIGSLLERHGPRIEAFGAALSERVGAGLEAIGRMWDRHGDRVMSALGTAVGIAVGVLEGLRDALVGALGWLADNRPVLLGVAAAIGTFVVGAFVAWAVSATAAAVATLAAAAPFIAIGVAIAAVVAGLIYAYTEWDWFRQTVDAVASFMTDTLWPILQDVARFLAAAFVVAVETASDVVRALVSAFRTAWRWAQQLWDRTSGLRSFLAAAFTTGVGVARSAIDFMVGAFRAAWRWGQNVWDRTEGLRGFLEGAFTTGVDIASAAVRGVFLAFTSVWRWAQRVWDRTEGLRDFLAGAFKTGFDIAKGVIDGVKGAFDGVVGAIKTAIEWVEKLIGWIGRIPRPNLPGGFDGGGAFAETVGDIVEGARARGGSVRAGRAYWVGEEGPELVRFDRSGYVTPSDRSLAVAGARDTAPTVVLNHYGQTVTPATISAGIRLARLTT